MGILQTVNTYNQSPAFGISTYLGNTIYARVENNTATSLGSMSLNTDYEVKYHNNQYVINDRTPITVSQGSYEPTHTLPMFKLILADGTTPNDNTGFIGRVHYCKIWRDGSLVRDMIPAFDTQTNKFGMLDSVTGQFFGDASGEGTFTGGNL